MTNSTSAASSPFRRFPPLRRCKRQRTEEPDFDHGCSKSRRAVKQRQRCSKSDDAVVSPITIICDNLLTLILQLLPSPRSIIRCKSVCKRWNSLISNPDSLRRIVSLLKIQTPIGGEEEINERPLIYLHRPETHRSILRNCLPDRFIDESPNLQILASFNDLLLCGKVRSLNRYGRRFFVCNPFTKQWVTLPIFPFSYHTIDFGTHLKPGFWKEGECDTSTLGFVCEPCYDCDGNSGSVVMQNPRFRFRVVFMATAYSVIQVYTFVSESWEWKHRLFDPHDLPGNDGVPSTAPYHAISAQSTSRGKLFWKNCDGHVGVYDPFDSQQGFPSLIDCSHLWYYDLSKYNFLIGVSQGILRGMVFPRHEGAQGFFRMCRLEENHVFGRYIWRFDYKVPMKTVYDVVRRKKKTFCSSSSSSRSSSRVMRLGVLGVHPSRPEIIYFDYRDHAKTHNHDPFFFDFEHHCRFDDGLTPDHNYDPIYIVPFDMIKGDLHHQEELIPISESNATRLRFKYWGEYGIGDPIRWGVFQPVIPFWPTPIPVTDDSNKLRQMVEYDDVVIEDDDADCREELKRGYLRLGEFVRKKDNSSK